MAADAELGVMLEPTNDLEEEVGDVQASVGSAGGGDLSAGQQEQQENVVAGGVSKGLLAAGVIGSILSQLKSVGGLIEAIFGFFSRALLPAVEVIAELIRPLISGINDFISDPVGAVGGRENIQNAATGLQFGSKFLPGGAIGQIGGQVLQNPQETVQQANPVNLAETLSSFVGLGGPQSSDQTGEATKNKFKNAVDDAQRDKTGSFR